MTCLQKIKIVGLSVILALPVCQVVRAEGSAQAGLNQKLRDFEQSSQFLYVDIETAGEVINISLCGNAQTDDLSIEILDPAGASVDTATLADGNVDCTANPFDAAALVSPHKYTTTQTGTYKIRLENGSSSAGASSLFSRYDVSVTPDTATPPDPTVAAGRLWAKRWEFSAGGFAETDATDADFFVLVPGGRPDTDYVWKLDLNKLAGYGYEILANDIGLDAPFSGYSVVTPAYAPTVTPKFPVYVGYPAIANPRPVDPPVITDLRFIDNAGVDNSISPSVTAGTEDDGFFEFTSDVTGTYAITIDTSRDGLFGMGDVLLLGNAVSGTNRIAWNGKDAAGNTVGLGTYSAQVEVRLGEYHFVAWDVETSGGGVDNGFTIFLANSDGSTADTRLYWDDITYLPAGGPGTTTLPDGALSSTPAGRHTWGNFSSTSLGNDAYIDTYVYGLTTSGTTVVTIANNDNLVTGVDGTVTITPTSVPGDSLTITVTDADLNILATAAETVVVQVVNNNTGEVEQIALAETGIDTGLFTGTLATQPGGSAGTNNDGSMNTSAGNTLTVTYEDQLDAAGSSVSRTAQSSVSSDSDGDGILDTADLDDDNDGIPDTKEGPSGTDTDGDGIPDALDLDSDNDGILDAVESGAPAQTLDSDGRIVGAVGNNGLIDALESDDTAGAVVTYNGGDPVNTDGIDTPDFRDPDSDNDGVNDVIEAGGPTADPDGDGLIGSGTPAVNSVGVAAGAGLTPPDTDGDGNPDFRDLVGDTNSDHDGDGVPDPFDLDDDNDGIPDLKEGPAGTDTDGDGIVDSLDLDSDNDGIRDAVESGASGVTITAGRVAGAVGVNGLPDAVESAPESGVTNYNSGEPVNTDGDSVPDFRDLDTDNDGITDVIEAGGGDPDRNALAGSGAPPAVDAEGVATVVGAGIVPADTDNDSTPDYRDQDSDNDGINDVVEAGFTDDGNGMLSGFSDISPLNGLDDNITIKNPADLPDSDGDGIVDFRDDDDNDTDNDGVDDAMDIDDDNDGILDSAEQNGTRDVDTDGDGVVDRLDLDSDNDGILDVRESGADLASLTVTGAGRIDISSNPVGANGLVNSLEDADTAAATVNYNGGIPVDTDSDGVQDFRDLDSDDDGITDVIEAGGSDPDGNGLVGSGSGHAVGVNGSGLATALAAGGLTPSDSDNDGTPDFQEGSATTPAAPPRLETGLDGGLGCTLSNNRSIDPVFPLLVLFALFYLVGGYTSRKRGSITLRGIGIVAASGLLMFALMPPVSAETGFESRWYGGLGAGISELEPDPNTTVYTNDEIRSSGGKLFLGYDWSKRVSIEGYYSDLGDAKIGSTDPAVSGGNVGYRDYGLSALYYVFKQRESHEGFGLFGRLGFGKMENDTDLPYKRLNDTHAMLGAGLEYAFRNGFALRGEFDYYDTDSQLLALGLLKRFGGSKQEKSAPAPQPAPEPTPVPVAPPAPEPKPAPVVKEVKLGKLGIVYFDTDSAELTTAARATLDDVAAELQRAPAARVEVQGNTDSRGSDAYNLALSERRAQAVVDYLLGKGISPDRLEIRAFGENNPVERNNTAEGRRLNRRVEFREMEY